jgi:hypothetical protein
MKQTFLQTPGIGGMDSYVARLADGCAVTLRHGSSRDHLAFDLICSASENTPAQSFSLSSTAHLRPLRDVLNAALDDHDTKYGIVPEPEPNFGTDHLERKLGLALAENERLVRERGPLEAQLTETKRLLESQRDANKWQADKIGEHWQTIEGQRSVIQDFTDKHNGFALREKAMTVERDELQEGSDRLKARFVLLRDSWLSVHTEWENSKEEIADLSRRLADAQEIIGKIQT